MGFWYTLFLWTATFVLSDFFRPRLPSQTPAGLGDFNIPTATEGRHIPIMTGEARMNGPNCVWYGDYVAERRTVKTGLIFRRSETIGFTYFLALQYAQVRTEVAGITGVYIGDEKVFDADADNGGDPALVVDIDRPDLFGGEDEGGGFVGRIRLHNGAQDQAVSSYLATRQSPTPAYRGTCYAMVTDVAETGGANIGETNQLREIRLELRAFDTVANGGLGDSLALGNDHHFIGKNVNPIVWAWEIFTNTDWGRSLNPTDDLNLSNFQAAAETIWSEGLGFSRIYDDVMQASAMIDEIEQHVDGYIGPNPVTGQLEVILARDDYTLANEFQADASNVAAVTKWSKGDWNQTKNEVKVQFSDRTKAWKDTYAQAQSLANRAIQGRAKTLVLRYPGVHDADVANKIAWREAGSRFRALASGTIELNREAYALRPGKILALTDEDVNETNLACRIIAVGKGTVLDNAIEVQVVQDVFANETAGSADPPASDFVPPIQEVVAFAAADQAAVEAPRVLMRYDEDPDVVPRILTFARRTGGNPTAYEVIRRVRATFGSGVFGSFESSDIIDSGFMDVGTLRSALTGWQAGNGAFSIAVDPIAGNLDELIGDYSPGAGNAAGVAVIEPGTDAEEWLVFSSVVDDGAGISLEGTWRACADSAMLAHSAGARVWFIWTGGLGLPLETYAAGAGVEPKFLPRSPSDAIEEAEATALDEVEMHDPPREGRPLMPRSLLLNGAEFPVSAAADNDLGGDVDGIEVTVRLRSWRVDDVLDSVRGFNQAGAPLAAADLTVDDLSLEYWLYDLDTTPTPARVDAILTASFAVDAADQVFQILADDLITAGQEADFAARLEIELTHSPSGEAASQITLQPMFFDFDIVDIPVSAILGITKEVWFDASDGSTITIDTGVSQWNDKSGNDRHAIQATAAEQPAVASEEINLLDVVRWDGTDDVLEPNYATIPLKQQIYMLYKTTSQDRGTFWGANDGSSDALRFSLNYQPGTAGSVAGTLGIFIRDGVANRRFYAEIGAALHDGTPHILMIESDGEVADAGRVFFDGTEVAIVNAAQATFVETVYASGIGFGSFHGSSTDSEHVNADVGEFMTTAILSQADQEIVEGYLAHKWGIEANLPAGHPYKSTPP